MPGVKNQHYVPRFYLRSFTDDPGYLSVVRRDAGGLTRVFLSKPEYVCAENYLYEVRRRASGGEVGFIEKGVIEDALGKIENELAPNYRSLLSYLDSGKLPKGEECVELISRLAFLLAFFIVRNPKWLNEVRGNAGARSTELLSSGFFSDEDISQMVLAGYEEECDKDPCGFYFPLSPRYAVVFEQRLEEERCVSISHLADFAVDSLNRMLMNGDGLWEFLIARDRSILERLIEEYRDRV